MANPKRSRKSSKKQTEAVTQHFAKTIATAVEPAVRQVVGPVKTTPAPEPTKPANATATGARYAVLTGRPSKPSVIYVFTKTGYALSWVQRAVRLGITPEALCELFRTDAEALKARWAALTTKKA